MAKIHEHKISWLPSISEDVVGYKFYYVPEGENLNYGSPSVTLGNIDNVIIPSQVPDFPLVDGNVTIGLSSLDDVGNESDLVSKTVPFDLVAPEAPTALVVTIL